MQGSVARKLDTIGDEIVSQEITFRPSLWEHLRAWAKSTMTGGRIVEEVLLMTLLTVAILSWGGFILYLHYLLQAYRVV